MAKSRYKPVTREETPTKENAFFTPFSVAKYHNETSFIWFTPHTPNLIPFQTMQTHMIICISSLKGLQPICKSICKSFTWSPLISQCMVCSWDYPSGLGGERATFERSFESRLVARQPWAFVHHDKNVLFCMWIYIYWLKGLVCFTIVKSDEHSWFHAIFPGNMGLFSSVIGI